MIDSDDSPFLLPVHELVHSRVYRPVTLHQAHIDKIITDQHQLVVTVHSRTTVFMTFIV